jgi:hypothetical protein
MQRDPIQVSLAAESLSHTYRLVAVVFDVLCKYSRDFTRK